MGWDYTKGATKISIINDLTKPIGRHRALNWSNQLQKSVDAGYDVESKILDHTVKGNTLWMVLQQTKYYPNKVETDKIILCCLLDGSNRFGWGYKMMDEGMGPFHYNCPLKYLDMAPERNQEWRANVRKNQKVTV